MKHSIEKIIPIDISLIHFSEKISLPFSRVALFVIYFWFGVLKIFDLSPATPLVHTLFDTTLPWAPFQTFIILFGLFEIVIGILFLFKKATRIVIPLLVFHLFTTALPLFLLPHDAWIGFLIPTMEGQYIIKNLLIMACALEIVSSLTPLSEIPKKKSGL